MLKLFVCVPKRFQKLDIKITKNRFLIKKKGIHLFGSRYERYDFATIATLFREVQSTLNVSEITSHFRLPKSPFPLLMNPLMPFTP